MPGPTMLPSRIVAIVVAVAVFFVVAPPALASTMMTTLPTTTKDTAFFAASYADEATTSVVVVRRRLFALAESIVSIRGGGGGDGDDDESYDDESYDEEEEEEYDDDDEYEVEYDDEEADAGRGNVDVGAAEEEDEEAEELREEDSTSAALDLAIGCAKKLGVILGKATVEASRAVQRAAEAGLAAAREEDGEREGIEEEEDEVSSIAAKLGRLLSRMWEAAVHPREATDGGDDGDERRRPRPPSENGAKKKAAPREGGERGEAAAAAVGGEGWGARLARSYGVDVADGGSGGSSSPTILGGTLSDALRSARSDARLLVAFVPASRPSSSARRTQSSSKSYDRIAIGSLLSSDVCKIVDRRPVKTKKTSAGGGGGGSFAIWSASHGSREASTAVKRLRVKAPAKKSSPILAVAYPAQVLDRTTGHPKLVPRLLAQHHCNPPPSPSSLASWLDALRKRHAKQYASMIRDIRESEYYRERKEGYKSSVVEDRERERREKAETARREEEERREKARLERLERRRIALREGLPPEPSADDTDAFAIALRFVDGGGRRTGGQVRRRFDPGTDLNVLFDWVDAEHGLEREKVTLTTMDGRKSFEFCKGDNDDDDAGEEEDEGALQIECGTTLRDARLKRMTALRVSETKEGKEEAEEEEEDEEEDR